MPRFHSELGPFIGLAGSLDTRVVNGGFDSSQTDNGWVPGLEASLWAGYGLEGALGEASDGLIYGSVGYRIDAASSNLFTSDVRNGTSGDLSAAIPSRSGLTLRFRMPFYLLPADLLFLSPLYLVNPDAYVGMAVTAANGGLIPWQTGIATAIGRFQFVLGREVGITFYGLDGDNQLLIPGTEAGGFGRLVNFKSTSFEIPILEYRPYRSFASNHTSSAIFQLYGGVDVPRGATVVLPANGQPVDLGNIWFIGLRMTFDWRFYFQR
jgi:hypothetical protein